MRWFAAMAMPLDPDARAVLDLIRLSGRPALETLSAAEAREAYMNSRAALQPEPPVVVETRDLTAPGPLGPIPLRLYRGQGCPAGQPTPALVYYHGGGWVIGNIETHDGVCRHLANAAACSVVSVDYRLAPEHPYPAAVEDSLAALRYVQAEAASLGIDPARIAVGGDSAGGNLAAVAAIDARDKALPKLAFQLLLYPGTDLAGHQGSHDLDLTGFPLTATTMHWFVNHYAPERAARAEWRASPLRVASLAGVATAYVMTCGYDPLRDEGRAYAERLEQDGVRTTFVHHADQMHGFLTMGKFIRTSATALDMAAAALRLGFAAVEA